MERQNLADLLEEAFGAFKKELADNSSSEDFISLRRSYGEKIRSFWGRLKRIHDQNLESKELEKNEKLCVNQLEEYQTDDPVLLMRHMTPLTESELSLTGREGEIDFFLTPPKITCKKRITEEDDWNIQWEVTYRGLGISTITKATVFESEDYQLPYVKYIETIDASIFGVDRLDQLNPILPKKWLSQG